MTRQRPSVITLALVGLFAVGLGACASGPKLMGPVATSVPPPSTPPTPYGDRDRGMVSEAPLDGGSGPGSARDFVIHAGDLVYFDFDRFEVRSEARSVLDTQAAWLARYPAVRVRIEGNTDAPWHSGIQLRPGCASGGRGARLSG